MTVEHMATLQYVVGLLLCVCFILLTVRAGYLFFTQELAWKQETKFIEFLYSIEVPAHRPDILEFRNYLAQRLEQITDETPEELFNSLEVSHPVLDLAVQYNHRTAEIEQNIEVNNSLRAFLASIHKEMSMVNDNSAHWQRLYSQVGGVLSSL